MFWSEVLINSQSVFFNLCDKNKLIVDLKCINQSEYQIIWCEHTIHRGPHNTNHKAGAEWGHITAGQLWKAFYPRLLYSVTLQPPLLSSCAVIFNILVSGVCFKDIPSNTYIFFPWIFHGNVSFIFYVMYKITQNISLREAHVVCECRSGNERLSCMWSLAGSRSRDIQ